MLRVPILVGSCMDVGTLKPVLSPIAAGSYEL